MDIQNIISKITSLKKTLKDSVVIPAHHYIKSDIIAQADIVGDSYKLAKDCSKTQADFILFCGVKFMAEGARLLAKPNQKVLMPTLLAGCPLAEMIDESTACEAYKLISSLCAYEVAPIVYVNSNVSLKSFCGKHNGAICTSSNAGKIINTYLNQGKAVFFSPDYNLGVNSARILQIPENQIVIVKKDLSLLCKGSIKNARIFLWDGCCYVHKKFTVEHIRKLREQYPNIQIIVHPECDEEVVLKSDFVGSTQTILNTIKDAPTGSIWGVGTEYHFVERMAQNFSNKTILPLKISCCEDMGRITFQNVYESLQSIVQYPEKNSLLYEVTIPVEYYTNAKKAMHNMLSIVENNK